MIREMPRIAAPIMVAIVSMMLFGGGAQAGDPVNRDGPDGKAGTGKATCRYVPPPEDGLLQCTARGGSPGAGGKATVDY